MSFPRIVLSVVLFAAALLFTTPPLFASCAQEEWFERRTTWNGFDQYYFA